MSKTNDKVRSLDSALRELHGAVEGLIDIVEGCRGERWASNGRRLVDSKQWCRLYVARCDVNEAADIAAAKEARK